MLKVVLNGVDVTVAPGTTVAAALLAANVMRFRTSVTGQPRAPLCGMGVCMECRVTIDGRPQQVACQTLCAEGMQVVTG